MYCSLWKVEFRDIGQEESVLGGGGMDYREEASSMASQTQAAGMDWEIQALQLPQFTEEETQKRLVELGPGGRRLLMELGFQEDERLPKGHGIQEGDCLIMRAGT